MKALAGLITACCEGHADFVASMPDKAENPRQEELQKQHGTPREFAQACVNAIGDISSTEARDAALNYQNTWLKA